MILLSTVDLEEYNSYKLYRVRLENGDQLTGFITLKSNDDNGEYIELETLIGTPKIYLSEIKEIQVEDNFDRQSSRVHLMPTADPIKSNHFIGSFEALMVIAGFGISDIGSITVGRSIIPFIRAEEQITLINGKATVYGMDWASGNGGMKIGIGGNMLWLNDANNISHLFTNATFFNQRSSITIMVFSKIGAKDIYDLRINNEVESFIFEDGATGVGLGFTSRFSERSNMYFIGELWNQNVQKPLNSGVLLGFRLSNTEVSADFGLTFFTTPIAFPFFSFSWTPF